MFKNINKKRIIIVSAMLLFSIGVFNFINSVEYSKRESISANATPIANKVVILDAGHRTSRSRGNGLYRNNRRIDKSFNSFKITKINRTKWS